MCECGEPCVVPELPLAAPVVPLLRRGTTGVADER